MIKHNSRLHKALSLLLALVMLAGLLPVFSISAGAASGASADMDALGALGIDSSKAPEGFDANSTDNPYGRDIVSLGTVSELYTVGLKNAVKFGTASDKTGLFYPGGTLSPVLSHNKVDANTLQAALYGHMAWGEKEVQDILTSSTAITKDIAAGNTTTTSKNIPISQGTIADLGNDSYKSFLTGAENITTALSGGFDYGMSSVAAGNFDKNAEGLQAQTVMVYTSDYSANGGLYLRFGDAVDGSYGTSAITLLGKDKKIGNPELTFEGKMVENFAENPYQLQNYLQVATGDWNGDGLDEVAVYVPELGNSRIEIYALSHVNSDHDDAYQDAAKWSVAWTYYLREGTVVSNMVSLVSGDMNRDGTDDLAATWGYYYGPEQNKGSTAVVMFGGKGTEMFKKSQSFPLNFEGSNLVRASFAFGDMAGGKGEDTLILCAQSDADLRANKPFTRYVALYSWNGSSFVTNIAKNFDLFQREKKEGTTDWTYIYDPVMTTGRNLENGNYRFYSQPLCVANTAVLRRGVAGGGDLLYFDSLIFSYGDQGLAIKEAWDITEAMQKNAGTPKDYVEYGAAAGDLTGQTGASALFTMTQTLASYEQKETSYTVGAFPLTVPKFEGNLEFDPFGNWLEKILRIIFGIDKIAYVQKGTKTASLETVDVYYDEFQMGQAYLVAVEPKNGGAYYVKRTEADFSTSLCLANTDNDTSYMKYGGEHYFAYSDPAVLAVLASPPYFADLLNRDDLSGSYGESTTTYSSTTGSGGSTTKSSTISVGAYVSFEQEISFFGISAGKIEAETTVTAGFTWETESSSSLEQTVTYYANVGEDMVAFYSIPMEIYKYTTYVPDGSGKYTEVLTTVNLPHEASVRVISLEDYENIAEDYSVLPRISNNVLNHAVGNPASYPKSTSAYNKPIVYTGDPAKVDFSSTGGAISQEIAMTEEESKSFTITGSLEFKAGAGAGGVTVGVVAGGELGEGTVTTTTSGSSFSGELYNMPEEARPFGYTMNWKIFSYLHSDGGKSFPVVNYLVSEVHNPAPLPVDFEQDIAGTTADSVALSWTYEGNVAGFNLYRYYDFPDGSGSYQIAYIPFNEGTKDGGGPTQFSYTDTGLSDYTEYKYQIQTVRAENPAKSIESEPLVCRTKTTKGYPDITIDGLVAGLLPIYPDSDGEATAVIKDAKSYKSLGYQWQKLENGLWKSLAGRTTNKLTISNASAGDRGSYRCRVNAIYFDAVSNKEYSISAYSETFATAYSKREAAGTISAKNQEKIAGGGEVLQGLSAQVELYSRSHAAAPTGTVSFTVTGTDYSFSKIYNLSASENTKDFGGTDKYYSTAELKIDSLPDGVYTVSAYYGGSRIFKDLQLEQSGNSATVIIGDGAESYVVDLRKSTSGAVVTNFIYGDPIYPAVSRISKENGAVKTEILSPEEYELTYSYKEDSPIASTGGGAPPSLTPGGLTPDVGAYILSAEFQDSEGKNVKVSRKFTVTKKLVTIYAEDKTDVTVGTVSENLPELKGVNLSSGELAALAPDYIVTNSADNIVKDEDFKSVLEPTPPGNYTVTPVANQNPGDAMTKHYNNYEITYVPGVYTIIGQTHKLTLKAEDYTDHAGTRPVGTAGISNVSGLTAHYSGGVQVVLYAAPQAGYEVDKWTATFADKTSKTQPGGNTWRLETQAQAVDVAVTFKKVRPQLFTRVDPAAGGEITWEDEGFASGAYVSTGAEFVFTAVPNQGYHFKGWQTASGGISTTPAGTDNGDGSSSLTITAGTASMTVFAYFERDSYTLTLEGNIRAFYTQSETSVAVPSGGKVAGDTTITVEPKPGYKAAEGAKYAINGAEQESGVFTITENTTVSLATERERYAVTAEAENGSIAVTVDGAAADAETLAAGIPGGSVLKFTPRAERGYVFEKWELNGAEAAAGTDGSLTVPALAGETAVRAVFRANASYVVKASVSDSSRGTMRCTLYDIYGTMVGDENQTMPAEGLLVYEGEKAVLSVAVNSASMIEQWQIDGASDYTTGKIYPFENIKSNINAIAFLKAAYDYKVSFIAMGDGAGSLSATADSTDFDSGTLLPGGSELVFYAAPKTNQMLDHWTITDGDIAAPENTRLQDENGLDLVEPALKIEYLRKNITVRAYFTDLAQLDVKLEDITGGTAFITYATPITGDDGALTNTTSASVRKGGTVKMEFEAGDGYKLDLEKLNTALSGRSFTVSEPAEPEGVYTATVKNLQSGLDLSGSGIFTPVYKITVPDHVTASPETAAEGEIVTLTVTPPAGKRLASLALDKGALNEAVTAGTLTYTFAMPDSHVAVAAEFEPIPSGGGGGGAPDQPTIPAADGTVRVNYTAAEGVASLAMPEEKLKEIIEKSRDGKAILDLSEVEGAAAAELPKNALTAFEQAGLDVSLKLPAGTISLDEAAASSVAGQVAGDRLSVELKQAEKDGLSEAQKKALKTGDIVLDINIRSGAEKIRDFDGKLTISLPYTGSSPVAVWYLNDAGELEKLNCTITNGLVVFTLDHLSLYVVGRDAAWVNPFVDVKEGDWFYDAVRFVHEGGLMNGVADKIFAPHGVTTRGMIVTILHRLEETPKPRISNPFDDVAAGKYYTEAVIWAAESKLVNGYGNGKFGPEDEITREQLAVIFLNYAKYKGYSISAGADLKDFADADQISGWAKDAMAWAKAEALIQGDGRGLNPAGKAERCQVAAILQRFTEKLAKPAALQKTQH